MYVCVVNDPHLHFVLGTTPRSMGGTPQRGSGGGTTPGRASVRDKLNINPEESLMEEYESGYGAKQQQARIITLINNNHIVLVRRPSMYSLSCTLA